MKKVLVLPGWMRELRFYGNSGGFDVQIGTLNTAAASADVVIGFSLGALIVLRESQIGRASCRERV